MTVAYRLIASAVISRNSAVLSQLYRCNAAPQPALTLSLPPWPVSHHRAVPVEVPRLRIAPRLPALPLPLLPQLFREPARRHGALLPRRYQRASTMLLRSLLCWPPPSQMYGSRGHVTQTVQQWRYDGLIYHLAPGNVNKETRKSAGRRAACTRVVQAAVC